MLICRDCEENNENENFVKQWAPIVHHNKFRNFIASSEQSENSKSILIEGIGFLERLWKKDANAIASNCIPNVKKFEMVKEKYLDENEYNSIMRPLIISEYSDVIQIFF